MKKKLFTIALALCMVFTMIPGGVFQVETAWAANGDTPASVKVGGVEMVGDNVTYYKNDGTEGSADDYNAMYEQSKNTLTLNNFNYTGTQNGIYANCDLNIVLQGHNSIEAKGINDSDWKNSYGVWTEGDLRIRGENQDEDKLYIRAHNGNAIFAFEDHSSQYNESITIKNAKIIAESFADVGIVASKNVAIEDSMVESVGKSYGIQGGHFSGYADGSITIRKSIVSAKTTGTEKSAFNIAPAISGVYEWATTETNRTYTQSTSKEFDNAGNPKFVDIVCWHSHCVCGKTHNKVGTHENEVELAFKKWTDAIDLPHVSGNYYLTRDVYISSPWEPADGTVLCLNGYSIICKNGTEETPIPVISVKSGATFTLTDCLKNENGNNKGEITHNKDLIGRGVDNYGTFYLYGGNIADNDNRSDSFSGGGVQNHIGATFTMYGGSITGNKDVNGAGVYNSVADSIVKRTVFTMYGGTISGNQANNIGGGVLNQGDFIMNGGSIDGNTATSTGGGVFVEVNTEGSLIGTFSVSGNVNITGNKVNDEDDNVYLGMSTDRAKTASIEIGGTLTGSQKIGVKTAKTPTGGDDTVTIATRAKSGDENYFVSDDSNYVVAYDNEKLVLKTNLNPPATGHKHYLCGANHTEIGDHTNDSEVVFTAWDKTDSLPTQAGNYYLTENVTLTTAVEYPGRISGYNYCGWAVPDGVVLCLNGKNITMKNPDGVTKDVDAIKVSGQFTLTDCKTGDAQGKITHAINSSNTKYKGKGVKVLGGTFNMYGGNITGNTSNYDTGGSGVCVVSNKTKTSEFKLYGGTISGNTAKNGGGVEVSKYIDEQAAEFYMYGGNIQDNTATVEGDWESYGHGGGVYVSHMAEFVMSGGIISGNTAKQFGGGIFANAFAKDYKYGTSRAAKLKISSNAVIKNNTADGSINNVYLDSSTTEFDTINTTLTIIGDLTGTIGVTTKELPTAGRPVTIATGAAADKNYSANITSDKNDYEIGHASNPTELILKVTGDPDPAPVTTPTISEQPKNLEITYGQSENFTVKATAATDTTYKPLQYQWYKNTTNSNTGGTKIEGAASATYRIPTNIAAGKYYYYCEVTAEREDNGQKTKATTNAAMLTVSKAPVTVTVNNQNAYINGTLPANSYKADGLVNGDKFNETSVKYEYKNAEDETVTPNLEQEGTYTIVISGLTLANANNYDVTYKPGTLTITKKQASSGGGSSTLRTEVITTGNQDSKVTSSPSQVKKETKTDANGNNVTTATVTVSSANQREILRQAKANKSGEIIIKVSQNEVKDGAKVEMNLDKSFIESIVNDTDAKLTIQTPSGEKTFTQDELKKLAAGATGNTVTIDPTSTGTIKPTTPTEPTTPTNPSTDKNAKLVKGVENTTIVLKSKLTKEGKVLLTWTKSKGYKVDKFEVYRSVKRHSGYGKKAFFTTKDGNRSKYLNPKNLKAGRTYYYKVRGVRTIDGQKSYTQWSNKAWRTAK